VSSSIEPLREIRVPRETVNDDLVTIQRWMALGGAAVRARDVVAIIETSKATLDVEAGSDGYLQILHPEGTEVPVGALIGRVVVSAGAVAAPGGDEPKSPAPAAMQTASPAETESGSAAGPGGVTVSRKARALIDEHGIDVSVFVSRGLQLVRETDVIQYLQGRVESERGGAARAAGDALPTAASSSSPSLQVPSTQVPTPAAVAAPVYRHKPRGLLGDAAASAGERGRGTVWLVWNYFWRNWLLGNLVRVAPRGVINVLHRWRGVRMGRDCFIDPTAILETAYPENITMGDDVRVTVGCIVMTHIKAPHYHRDTGIMPAVLKPVVLRDHCFLGVNSVIMPGVTVGEAAVVASGAMVVADVPPYTMVAGNPAKVVRRFPNPHAPPGAQTEGGPAHAD
jgi:acetyltransferase-like isoleucine patch superfamily enzyme